MILKLVILQGVVAGIVVWVLREILERELIQMAIDELMCLRFDVVGDVKEVTVVSAYQLPDQLEGRMKAVLKDRFPEAKVSMVRSRELWGGVVCQVGKVLIDHSLSNRLKYLWGQEA